MVRTPYRTLDWWQLLVIACFSYPHPAVPSPYEDVGCRVVDAAGNVKDGASYTWIMQNFTIYTPPPQETNNEMPSTIRFLLSGSLLQSSVLCQGATHSPDLYEWQSCTLEDGSALKNSWLSYSYSFLIQGYLQLNQTWFCERNNKR